MLSPEPVSYIFMEAKLEYVASSAVSSLPKELELIAAAEAAKQNETNENLTDAGDYNDNVELNTNIETENEIS